MGAPTFAAVSRSGDAGQVVVGDRVSALFVSRAKTPPLRIPAMNTKGTYPQVSRVGFNLRTVNAVLRRAVLDDERRFARIIPKVDPKTAPGLYETSVELGLISASTVVVSVLMPSLQLFPAGNDGDRWLSINVDVATGRRVSIAALFTDPSQGLRAIATDARKRLPRANACVRQSLTDSTHGRSRGFDPTITNYRNFALLPDGLAIGFPLGQVSDPLCSSAEITVPYSVVRPYLNALGHTLILGVRRPITHH
jgi:hypothetical protein